MSARQLTISLRKCTGHSYCKSEAEMKEYFRHKFLLMLYNEVSFDQNKYGEETRLRQG